MVAGVGFEPHDLRVIPLGRLAAFAIPGPGEGAAARQWRGCGKTGPAVSAPGGAGPLFPTSPLVGLMTRRQVSGLSPITGKKKHPSDWTDASFSWHVAPKKIF